MHAFVGCDGVVQRGLCIHSACFRQAKAHDKAVRMGVVCAGGSAMLAGDAGDQRQAEARAVGGLVVCPPEALKDVGQLVIGHAGAVVGDLQGQGGWGVGLCGSTRDADGDDAMGWGVGEGVVDEVADGFAHHETVAADKGGFQPFVAQVFLQGDAFWDPFAGDFARELGDVVAVGRVVAGRLRFAARQREHLPHQLYAAQGGGVDFADALVALRQQVRTKAGKQATPSVAIMDSQSVKTVSKGGSAATTRARKPRVQAPHSRRHTGTAAGGSGVFGRHPGSGGRQGAFGAPVYALRAFQAHLCRWWLCGQAHRLEQSHVWLNAASDQAPGATQLQGIAQTLDRGENLCLVQSVTQTLQGL